VYTVATYTPSHIDETSRHHTAVGRVWVQPLPQPPVREVCLKAQSAHTQSCHSHRSPSWLNPGACSPRHIHYTTPRTHASSSTVLAPREASLVPGSRAGHHRLALDQHASRSVLAPVAMWQSTRVGAGSLRKTSGNPAHPHPENPLLSSRGALATRGGLATQRDSPPLFVPSKSAERPQTPTKGKGLPPTEP
jgi:hypothetical protein